MRKPQGRCSSRNTVAPISTKSGSIERTRHPPGALPRSFTVDQTHKKHSVYAALYRHHVETSINIRRKNQPYEAIHSVVIEQLYHGTLHLQSSATVRRATRKYEIHLETEQGNRKTKKAHQNCETSETKQPTNALNNDTVPPKEGVTEHTKQEKQPRTAVSPQTHTPSEKITNHHEKYRNHSTRQREQEQENK